MERDVSWADRQTYGRKLTIPEFCELVAESPSGGDEWRHVDFVATMACENGLQEWARPMVWAPDKKHHLSTDRGVCALNSFWWSHVPDIVAFDPPAAVEAALEWLTVQAAQETKGSKWWRWGPLLDWQWHAYDPKSEKWQLAASQARAAFNVIRTESGKDPL